MTLRDTQAKTHTHTQEHTMKSNQIPFGRVRQQRLIIICSLLSNSVAKAGVRFKAVVLLFLIYYIVLLLLFLGAMCLDIDIIFNTLCPNFAIILMEKR